MWKRHLTVAAFTLQRDAEALCGELQQQGIEASVADKSVAVGYGESWMRVFQVQVLRDAFDHAGIILAAKAPSEARGPRQFSLRAGFLAITVACVLLAIVRVFGVEATLFAVAFVSCGTAAIVAGIVSARRGRASCEWPCVRGRVTRAYIGKTGDRGVSDYQARIDYRFQVDGCDYTADTVRFFAKTRSGMRSNYEIEREEIMRFPAGLEVDVFYDPARPANAVLERGAKTRDAVIFCAIGLAFIVLGVACFVWMPRR